MKPSRPLTRMLVTILLLVGGLALLVYGGLYYRAWSAYSAAERYLSEQRWAEARTYLRRYLQMHPGDDEAHLLMAEAWVNDNQLPPPRGVDEAIRQLHHITDSSPLAAEARVREAKLAFLIQYRPAAAERLLRRAIELDKDSLEAHSMLWRVLDMTTRSHYVEPVFRRVYELTPVAEQPLVLRQWYLSQFAPGTANAELDRGMGFLAPTQMPDSTVEFRRLLRFRNEEPDAPMTQAALASWFQREADPEQSLKLLREAASLEGALETPLYVSCLVSTLVDLGHFTEAQRAHELWPEGQQRYDYWMLHGTIQQQLHRNYADAIQAYNKAHQIWPGHFIWTLLFRQAQCHDRLNQPQRAEKLRAAAERIQQLMERERHQELREALGQLDNPESLATMARFYEQLGRSLEAEWWRDHAARLRSASTTPD